SKAIGKVTSGTMSPSLGKAIGLGYLKVGYSQAESEIFIKIRNNLIRAKVVKLPFYSPN
ncbi:MAG TPA: glycine cleavage system aminomethyltransferase GcvT, partial [Flavobacteriales bacterium]|nr:glycine cleavage system aminomethyltransferase GcvT [Flavobacteriales bacterium]